VILVIFKNFYSPSGCSSNTQYKYNAKKEKHTKTIKHREK